MTHKYALDIDGTICNTNASCVREVARALGLLMPDPGGVRNYYDQASIFPPEHRAEAQQLFNDFYASNLEVYASAEPLPGCLEVVNELHKRGVLTCYITRRPAAIYDTSVTWLSTHGFPELPVICLPHHVSKAEAMREVGATTIFEDSGHEALACVAAGFRVLLIETPYNREVEGDFHRSQGWADPKLLDLVHYTAVETGL